MRIDALKTSPDRAGRYFVSFSDGSTMRVYRQTLESFGLYTGKELSSEEMTQLTAHAKKTSAQMRAVRIVSASSVSRKSLEERLVQKGESYRDAVEAAQWMENLNLINDRNTAEQVIHSCIAKGYGLQRAKQALYEKKIPKEFWDEALAEYPDQSDKIRTFLQSRLSADSDEKAIKRAVDALIRRGHSYSRIRDALNQLKLETDEFPEDL